MSDSYGTQFGSCCVEAFLEFFEGSKLLIESSLQWLWLYQARRKVCWISKFIESKEKVAGNLISDQHYSHLHIIKQQRFWGKYILKGDAAKAGTYRFMNLLQIPKVFLNHKVSSLKMMKILMKKRWKYCTAYWSFPKVSCSAVKTAILNNFSLE